MLKKSLLALIVLAILAIPALADIPEQATEEVKKVVDTKLKLKSGGWPVDFAWVDLEGFKIPVYINVELYMEILNMQEVIDEGILLSQDAMDKYSGCSIPIEIKSNFNLKLGVKDPEFTADCVAMKAEKDKLEVRDEDCKSKKESVPATLCETTAKRTVFFSIKKVALVHHEFGKKIKCADLQVRVKPDFTVQWVDP